MYDRFGLFIDGNSFALAASEAPFGGTKYSGMGREGGTEGIADYLDTKLAQIVF